MKIIRSSQIADTDREVKCPNGGFTSRRLLLEKDNMGYGVTHTFIPPNGIQKWHYKNHLESCFCIKGHGRLIDVKTGEEHLITQGTMYVLDNNDEHTFLAYSDVELICVFNPPLKGNEIHLEDGSYE